MILCSFVFLLRWTGDAEASVRLLKCLREKKKNTLNNCFTSVSQQNIFAVPYLISNEPKLLLIYIIEQVL